MNTIAFLGLGAMGSRMAKNLLNAGYKLYVWNRTACAGRDLIEDGAIACASPKDAVSQANIVISTLTDDDASKEVWLNKQTGALSGLQSGTIVVECSTLSANWCTELAAYVEKHSAAFLDAPVLGSRPQAEAGQLIHLVGGDEKNLQRVTDVLVVNAAVVHHVGSTGNGMILKLAVNALFGCQVAALGEILGVLQKSDISVEQSIRLLNELPTTSPALKGIGSLIAAGNFKALFPISLVEKDLGYLEQLSKSVDSDIPALRQIISIFKNASESGYRNDNIAGVAQLYL